MDKDLLPRMKRRKRRQLWKRIVGTLGVLVVFCTVYALVLPAITLSDQPVCGLDAHTHTEDCYLTQLVSHECPLSAAVCEEGVHILHSHSDLCYDYRGDLICQLPERAEHIHGDDCYTDAMVLTCRLAEIPEHSHSESCYDGEALVCTQIESAGHTHEAACYTLQKQTVCGMEAVHPHNAECFDPEGTLLCDCLTGEYHVHDETCLKIVRLEVPELLCSHTAHTHDDTCYKKSAGGGTPTVNYLCGYSRHTHIDTCYTDGILDCTIPEHIHDPGCLGLEFDPTADVETPEDWETALAQLPLTGRWREDLVNVAKSQLGYRESETNLTLSESGILRGYTRYGARFGTPYIDWSTAFLSFCSHYAGIDALPQDTACDSYITALENTGLYREAGRHLPQSGDLIFLSDHRCGIVTELLVDEAAGEMIVRTIQGDTPEGVSYVNYKTDDPAILGYGQTPEGASRGLVCTEDHDHTAECYEWRVYYNDDTLFVQATITGAGELPENLSLEVSRITAVSSPEAFEAMRSALNETLKDAPYDVGSTGFFDMKLYSGAEVYTLPQGANIRVQVTFSQSMFTPKQVEKSLGIGTFTLTQNARKVRSLSTASSTYQAVAVAKETYQGTGEGITGVTFETDNLTAFAVMLAQTEADVTYWTRVTDPSQLDGGTYLIISAEGNYALKGDNSDNSTAVHLEGVKGNTEYFTVKTDSGYIDINHYWTIKPSGSGYTVQNQGTSNYLYMNRVRDGWSYKNYVIYKNSRTMYFNYFTPENCWRITDGTNVNSAGALNNVGTGDFNYTSSSNGSGSWGVTRYYTRDMLVLKLDETANPTIPKDFSEEQTGNAGLAEAPEKPDYGAFITPSGSKTGTTQQTDPQGGAAVNGSYYSDTATSDLESQFRKDTMAEHRVNDGKVLSDKSVIYGFDDYGAFSSYGENTFSVTLSALGQDYETPYQDTVRVPIDVMFVLDVSGSMTVNAPADGKDSSRATAMTKAVNATIKQIMDDHPANRVGVVIYSGGAWDMLPIGRYTADNDAYLDCSEKSATHAQTNYTQKIYFVTGSASLKDDTGKSYAGVGSNAVQGWGTYTQAGIALGYEYFKAMEGDTTYTTTVGYGEYVREYTVNRQPVFILLSDGEPTHSTNLYNDVLNGPHYGDGNGGDVNAVGVHGYNTILSANYYKRMVGIQYQTTPLFYTIGMGINEVLDEPLLAGSSNGDNYKRAVLNPTVENITGLSGGKNVAKTTDQLRNLMLGNYSGQAISTRSDWPEVWTGVGHIYTPVVTPNPYADNYSYADESFFGDPDSDELTEIFSKIILSSLKVKPYGFILYKNSSVDIIDNIGYGMEIKGTPVLRYGGVNYTDPEITVEGNVTIYTYQGTVVDPYIPNRKADLSLIRVSVTQFEDGSQTVEMYVPDMALPTYTPELIGNQFYYESLPVRLIYQVGLTQEAQQQVLDLRETGGELVFYTNRWEIDGEQAYTTLLPSTANPFYNDADPTDDIFPAYHAHQDAKVNPVTDTLPYRVNCHLETYDGEHGTTIQVTHELGNNGKLVFSAPEPKDPDIPVEKVWDETVGEEKRQEISLTLYAYNEETKESTALKTLTLSADNGWAGAFTEVEPPAPGIRYYIREDTEGYHVTYSNPEILTVEGASITVGAVVYEDAEPLKVTVTNAKQYLLPETGGFGNQMYFLAGFALMLGAALILIVFTPRKRKEESRG